ncbi:hypothetical protein J0S82_001494 [Galemys pyrenaicus]|uniref:Uncharacterized protein n=1 Tax=Galemys pyrenaicus TaxID=202257 RepID=A0A8J5ZLL7_GALPY|nr:hypothetical protein J0S82_001494 [Galemys pyrenaicus]
MLMELSDLYLVHLLWKHSWPKALKIIAKDMYTRDQGTGGAEGVTHRVQESHRGAHRHHPEAEPEAALHSGQNPCMDIFKSNSQPTKLAFCTAAVMKSNFDYDPKKDSMYLCKDPLQVGLKCHQGYHPNDQQG